jgi:hypothetical protein
VGSRNISGWCITHQNSAWQDRSSADQGIKLDLGCTIVSGYAVESFEVTAQEMEPETCKVQNRTSLLTTEPYVFVGTRL